MAVSCLSTRSISFGRNGCITFDNGPSKNEWPVMSGDLPLFATAEIGRFTTRSSQSAVSIADMLWEAVAAAPPAQSDPRSDEAAQPPPEIEFDQRLTW